MRSNVIDLDTYVAVTMVLDDYKPGDILSMAVAIDELRTFHPQCPCDDEELVAMILHAIGGRAIGISFDARLDARKSRGL